MILSFSRKSKVENQCKSVPLHNLETSFIFAFDRLFLSQVWWFSPIDHEYFRDLLSLWHLTFCLKTSEDRYPWWASQCYNILFLLYSFFPQLICQRNWRIWRICYLLASSYRTLSYLYTRLCWDFQRHNQSRSSEIL
jgi:hypothetical protein